MQSEAVVAGSGVATVAVKGEAVIRDEPDEAVLWITLSALESASGPALAHVTRRWVGWIRLPRRAHPADC